MNHKRQRVATPVLLGPALLFLVATGLGSLQVSAQVFLFSKAIFPAGKGPVAVAAGDFNGDGKLDLAVANRDGNTVSILLGKGDGTFSAQPPLGTGTSPVSVAVGDFNGDGKLDLAVVNETNRTVSVLLGKGDGTFATQPPQGTGTSPVSVAVGDFNRDGKLDLAVANRDSNTVSILLGNGDGTFQAHLAMPQETHPLR